MDKIADVLGRYQCTLSVNDQKTFIQLFTLETKQVILKFHPFVWGSSASTYYPTITDQRYTLFKLPRIDQVLAQYDKDKMLKTIHEFPLDLPLDPRERYEDREELYDPRFILLSLYHLLAPHNLVNCVKFISLRGLSITIVATSSNDPSIRSLAYCILNRFYQHLESSKASSVVYFWIHFIDCLRSTLTEQNKQNSYLLTTTLSLTIEVVNNPKNPLFYHVKDFLTQKGLFEKAAVSKFFLSLLNSNDLNWKYFQAAALNLLVLSVKTEEDFQICAEHDFYKNVLSLYTSEWVTNEAKLSILKFVKNCISIPEVLRKLLIEDGLIPWLTLVVLNSSTFHPEILKELNSLGKLLKKNCKHLDVYEEINSYSVKILINCCKLAKNMNLNGH